MDKKLIPYTEKINHYGNELFVFLPRDCEYNDDFHCFWAYMSKQFQTDILPMNDKALREKYIKIALELGIRIDRGQCLYNAILPDIEQRVTIGSDEARRGMYAISAVNKAFMRDKSYITEPIGMRNVLQRYNEVVTTCKKYVDYELDDIDVNRLLLVIDTTCSILQRDRILLLLGLFTGERLTYAEVSRKYNVSSASVRQMEHTVLTNTLRNPNHLLRKKNC